MSEDLIKKSICNVLNALADNAKQERQGSDAYKDLFQKCEGHDFTGLLRDAEHKMTGIALDACQVIEDKTGCKITKPLFEMLSGLPLISEELTREIRKNEGICCCVDKTFYQLNKFVLEQTKDLLK